VVDGDGRRRRDERDDAGGEVPGEREVRSDAGRRRLGEGGDETELLLLAVGRRYDMSLPSPRDQHGSTAPALATTNSALRSAYLVVQKSMNTCTEHNTSRAMCSLSDEVQKPLNQLQN
jgi:hypothetical protein